MTSELRTKCCNAKIRREFPPETGDETKRCSNCLLNVCVWCGDVEHQGAPANCGKVNVSSMTVTEKIKAGDYESKLPFPASHGFSGSKASIKATSARRDYREDTYRLSHVVFKADLLEENDLTSHPKADKLFDLAWEYGHSGGLLVVKDFFVEFMVLLK